MCNERRFFEVGRLFLWAGAGMVLFALSGCVAERSAVEDDFGRSVREMVARQTAPTREPTPALDGEKARKGLGVYRDKVSKPEKVSEDVRIFIGGR